MEGGTKIFKARIVIDDGTDFILPIADADSFAHNLDKAISDFAAQGSPYTFGEKIDIK